jgi:hypothetical protein
MPVLKTNFTAKDTKKHEEESSSGIIDAADISKILC